MRASRPHGFVAWLFDIYVFMIGLGALAGIWLAVTRRPGDLVLGLVLGVVGFAGSLSYHLWGAKRVSFLSPGEQMAGRFSSAEGKSWLNPYAKTRIPVFVVMLMTIVLAGNSWDGIADEGTTFTLGLVLGRTALLGAIVYALVQVGRGRAKILVLLAGYWLLLALGSPASAPDADSALVFAGFLGFVGLSALLLGFVYARWRLPPSDSGSPEPESV
jgi:hypothetical protein